MKNKDKERIRELEEENNELNIFIWVMALALIVALFFMTYFYHDAIPWDSKNQFQSPSLTKEMVCYEKLIECSWIMYNMEHGVTLCAFDNFIEKCENLQGDYCIFYEWKVEPNNYSYWTENCEVIK